MGTLYIDRRDAALDWDAGAILVRLAGERAAQAPSAGLERVVVVAPATLTTRLLAELWRRDIGLILLGGRTAEATARFLGKPHADARIRLAQYAAFRDEPFRARAAAALIAGKLAAQRRLLDRALAQRPDQRYALTRGFDQLAGLATRLAGAPDLPRSSLLGIEGAAAAYFEAFASLFAPALGFTGRNRRPPRDPINAVLSLAYTLIHFDAAREAQIAGLDPLIGLLHEPDWGRASLASDHIEPLRPRVDAAVWAFFAERVLRPEDFTTIDGVPRLGKAGRARFYQAWEEWARPLRRLLRRIARETVRALRPHDGG